MKLKTLIITFLLILSCSIFTGCNNTSEKIVMNETDTSRFQYIGRAEVTKNGSTSAADWVQYYVDNETHIVYIVMLNLNRVGNNTWAGFTPLIDADGSYTTYDEFIGK